MKNLRKQLVVALLSITLGACMGEAGDQLKKAKRDVSTGTSIVSGAASMAKQMRALEELEPIRNEDLKTWLPESLDGMERSGFRIGGSGMANVSSVEGTYKRKDTKKSFKVSVMDGAGKAGSVMAMSFGGVRHYGDGNGRRTQTPKNGRC